MGTSERPHCNGRAGSLAAHKCAALVTTNSHPNQGINMTTLVRPTALGLAMLKAATSGKPCNAATANKVIDLVMRREDASNPLKSGFNRTMQDNIRVSAKTLAAIS